MMKTAALADALVMLAGHDVTSRSAARRHQQAITTALPHVGPEHLVRLAATLASLRGRWGGDDEGEQNLLSCNDLQLVDWLATRRDRAQSFNVLQQVARRLLESEASLSEMRQWCFAISREVGIFPWGYDAFREWLLRLGVSRRITRGVYGPGPQALAISQMGLCDIAGRFGRAAGTA